MSENRRDFIKLTGVYGLLAAAGLLTARQAFAQQQEDAQDLRTQGGAQGGAIGFSLAFAPFGHSWLNSNPIISDSRDPRKCSNWAKSPRLWT